RRLRLRDRRRDRRADLRHGQPGHRLRGLEPGLVPVLRRPAAARRDPPQHLHPSPCGGSDMSTPTEAPAGRHAKPPAAALVKLTNVGKRYGAVIALHDINMEVGASEVTCVLGDNGAGKSTLIKIIAGLHQPSSGTYEVEGTPVSFSSPREALERGIATVYQDLAVVALMPVWRNFFLGNEVRKGPRIDIGAMKKMCKDELLAMGIDLRDVDQPIGTLSGGERQCVAISRAVHQSGVVLKYIVQARERGLGVIFITHNPHHAYPVGDRFLLLNRGASIGNYEKNQVTRDELTGLMAGGSELEQLSHELESAGGAVADLGRSMEADVEELGISHQPTTTTTTTTESDAR